MANAASGVVAMKHDLRGQSFGTVSACAAGAHAIGMAERLIRYGDADAVVTGGSEAAITPLATAAFAKMDALSDSGISRPFDRRRDGFVMGEGAGILVLEEEEAAKARGARILGYLRGYASTSDAHHLTAPDPSGRGAARAIELALQDADLEPEDVVYVNAHGTSTPLNDRAETEALKTALGEEHAARVPVSSTKSAIGHLLGAAGAVESIATLLALRDRIAPPTLNYEEPDEGLDLDYVPREARPLANGDGRAIGISNAFGFGGHNAVLCRGGFMSAFAETDERPPSPDRRRAAPDARRVRAARGPLRPWLAPRDPLDDRCRRRESKRMQAGDGVVGGSRHGRRAADVLLRAGPGLRGRLAGRGPRRHDHPRDGAGRARPRPRWSASSPPAARAWTTASRRSPATGASSATTCGCRARCPQISVISGVSAGGGSYSPALTDFVVMTEGSAMFLTGPGVVARGAWARRWTPRSSAARACTRATASASSWPTTTSTVDLQLVRDLLSYLPQRAGDAPRTRRPRPRDGGDPGGSCPRRSARCTTCAA